MSSSAKYAVNQTSNANFTGAWIQLPRQGGGSIGWQIILPSVTGTIAFDVTDDENPNAPSIANVTLGATRIVLQAPLLALSTPAAVAVNTLFEFSPGSANPCPTAKWMRALWIFSSGGSASGLFIGVATKQVH